MPVEIGARASVLLEILDRPRTLSEIVAGVDVANHELGMVDRSDSRTEAVLSLVSDYEGIRRQLLRLEQFGIVTRAQIGKTDPSLWWRA